MFPDTPKTLLRKIAELAQGDDRAEWEAFVELYGPPLKRFVEMQAPAMSDADVEDVVQDIFVRLVSVLREGRIDRGRAKFRAYLASMTRRLLIDRYRAAQVRPELGAGAGTDPASDVSLPPNSSYGQAGELPHPGSVPIEAIDPGKAVDISWRMAVHEAAMKHILTKTALSDQSKQIYEMLERGLSPREVAEKIGISYDAVKQVKSRIDRAVAAIEQRFSEE